MVAVMKKSTTPFCKFVSTSKLFAAICLVILFLCVSWTTIPSLLQLPDYATHPSNDIDVNRDNDIIIMELNRAIDTLRGDDFRLVQWDATQRTVKYQKKTCPAMLPVATKNLMDNTWLLPQTPEKQQSSFTILLKILKASLEICCLCITDNPTNREIFSNMGHELEPPWNDTTDTTDSATRSIHNAVVQLLQVPQLTPYAAHLIYIASFANRNNYRGFVGANAVSALSDIVVGAGNQTTLRPYSSIMWAAAALQNLAASYCTTPDDGRCYWEYKKQKLRTESNQNEETTKNTATFEYVLQLTSDSGKMVIDGTAVRQEIMSIPGMMVRLVQSTCFGPVLGKMSNSNPYPGHNAVVHGNDDDHNNHHEWSTNIVPWATTGVLKNLLIDATVRATFLRQFSSSMSCFCCMSKSKDWLEANKGEGLLQHLRVDSDPCWFDYKPIKRNKKLKREKKSKALCIDRIFFDTKGNTCEAYSDEETLTKDDCATPSVIDSNIAFDACCPCGGGDYYTGPTP